MVNGWERLMSDQTAAVARVDIPAHVDPALVVDFDFFADHRYAEAGSPHGGLLKLAEDIGRGIFWTPHNGGHWFITDHELLFEAARMPELFSSRHASFPAAPGEEPFYPPVNSDPPDHARYRLPLMRAFAPGRIRDLEKNIRAFAVELIEAVKDRGRCDFLDMVAEPLPIFIFMKLMGFDTARYREFREWAVAMSQPDVEIRGQAYVDTMAMARPLFDERRAERKEDVLSFLLDEAVDGRPFDQAELDGMCIELFGAGLDTVVNSLAFTVEHLARDPALQDRLRGEPALIPEAVEEVLRRYSVALPARSVKVDGSFHGAQLKAGERVALMLPAGNLDTRAFPDAARFDLDRENKTHIAFNTGPHRCVGSHLARQEMIILVEEWLRRVPNIRLDPERPPTYRTGLVFAVTSLNILWDAR
jgi:cytochrome P450